MNPVSMAGYQSSMQTPSLANFFGAAQVGQNRERLGLARKQLEMEAQAQAQKLAQDKQKQQSLAAYFSGGQGQTPAQPQMMPGQTPAQMPAQDPLAGGGAPMDTAQMQAPQPQMAPQTPQPNPMARYVGLARGGYNMDEIKGFIELERTGRKDIIEQMTDRAGAMAQAAQSVEQLPEEQRAEEWLRQTNQIEQAFGVDIPDHLQQYSPDNLNAVKARAIPVLDMWKQANPGPTAAIQGYAQAKAEGFKGSFMEYQMALKEAGASKVDARTLTTSETEEQKRRGALLVDNFKTVIERANDAEEQISYLTAARAIPETVNGKELPSVLQQRAGNIAVALGFDPAELGLDRITDGQQFEGLMTEILQRKLSTQKGPQTDKDADRIKATMADLGNTPAARQFLLDSAIAIAQRDVARREFFEEWHEKKRAETGTGTYDGAARAFNRATRNMPLMERDVDGNWWFWNQYEAAVRKGNPDMTFSELVDDWKAAVAAVNERKDEAN